MKTLLIHGYGITQEQEVFDTAREAFLRAIEVEYPVRVITPSGTFSFGAVVA